MGPDLKRFLVRAGLLGAPLAWALATYLVFDPFKVVRHYDFGNFYDQSAPTAPNPDYVGLQLFHKYYPTRRFDSFIFGSSRSFPIHCDRWVSYLPGARAFHYPAGSENIYGISKKLAYLEGAGVEIKHALVEVTTGLEGASPRWDAMHRLPYELTGESRLDFQVSFLKAYFSDFYFLKHMLYAYTGQRNAFNRTVLGIDRGAIRIEPETNDYYFASNERELAADAGAYYERRREDFPPHGAAPPCAPRVIGSAQRALLEQIRAVFNRQRTSYRIVRMPLYNQICLNAEDRQTLHAIFGEENVFDLTGVNAFTADERNFYDSGHVTAEVANRVLDVVYDGIARADR